jgi:predicted transposase YdaD
VREHTGEHGLEKAVRLAVAECVSRGILTEFLNFNATEILEMLKTEITQEELREFDRKVGIEIGMERGMERGMTNERRKNAMAMKADGVDVDTIAKWTGLTVDDILRL